MLFKPVPGDEVLSVRQPHAQLIVAGIMRLENRDQPTKFRGRLWIHSSRLRPPQGSWSDWLKLDPPMAPEDDLEIEESGTCLPPYSELECGSILGSVELFECVPREALPSEFDEGGFAQGRYCYLFRNSQALGKPVAARGTSGIWKLK